MTSAFTVLAVASWAGAAALLVALVACLLRRWRLAASLAGAAAVQELIVCLLLAAAIAIHLRGAFDGVDPSLRATMLAAGISEAVMCGVVPLFVAVVGGVVWRVARRRRPAR